MANVAQPDPTPRDHTVPGTTRCPNCGEALTGRFCSRCGQQDVQLHRPVRELLADLAGEVFSLDTRLLRTLGPLLFKPGQVPADYVAGRRASHVPPLRSYLIAALLFFGLFSLFPVRTRVEVVVAGTPEAEAARHTEGSRVSFELPRHVPVLDEPFQRASARARANPELFARTVYGNVPRLFFLFVPVFALVLQLFYRRQGYYVDHLIFSLYYHAFVFIALAALFLATRGGGWLPAVITTPLRVAVVIWLLAYLPIALRRAYGGTRVMTGLKLAGMGILYVCLFVLVGMPAITFVSLLFF